MQRAWQTAHRVAAMPYEDFGATQVAVFGSLAGQKWFSKGSDIDIAVWGLSGNTYLNALWEIRNFSSEFKIDLINFHSTKGRFRERIQSQTIRVQRGEVVPRIHSVSGFQSSQAIPLELSPIEARQYTENSKTKLNRATTENS